MNPLTANDHRAYMALCNAHNLLMSTIPSHWGFAKAAAKAKNTPYGAKYREPAQMLERHQVTYQYAYAVSRTAIDMAEKIREIREGEKNRPVRLKDGRFLTEKYTESVEQFQLELRACRKSNTDIRAQMHLRKTTILAVEGTAFINAYISPAWKSMTDKLGGGYAEKRYVILYAEFAFEANGFDFFRASVFDARHSKCLDGYIGRYKQDGEVTRMVYHESPSRCITKLTGVVAKLAFKAMMPEQESK
jgi:hypothetical protein